MSMIGSSLIRLPNGNAIRADLIESITAVPRRTIGGVALKAGVYVTLRNDERPALVSLIKDQPPYPATISRADNGFIRIDMPNFRAARQARDLLLDTLGVPPTGGPSDDMTEEDED